MNGEWLVNPTWQFTIDLPGLECKNHIELIMNINGKVLHNDFLQTFFNHWFLTVVETAERWWLSVSISRLMGMIWDSGQDNNVW